jgi:hypothetical protein
MDVEAEKTVVATEVVTTGSVLDCRLEHPPRTAMASPNTARRRQIFMG